jgi:hypothetical protein
MALPTVNVIRHRLADIENALVGEADTKIVDLGATPCVPLVQPEDQKIADTIAPSGEFEMAPAEEELSIIFEIPPEFDERDLKALGQSNGSDYERLIEVNGTDALAWYYPFHWRTFQYGVYISSRGATYLTRFF